MIEVPVVLLGRDQQYMQDARGGGHVQLLAALDSYATKSCVGRQFLQRQKRLTEVRAPPAGEPEVIYAFDDREVPRLGVVPLRIACGDHLLTHEFEVIDGADDMIVGLDLFPKLGIFVGGVPTEFPGGKAGQEAARLAAQQEAAMRERPRPWGLEDMKPPVERAALMAGIDTLLQANQGIPLDQPACPTIAEATMRLPLTLEAVYRHQYPIPEAAKPALREAMDMWRANGFVEPGNPSCDFNTPIVCAAKKDEHGVKTAWRICFDMRAINASLHTDATFAHSAGRMPHLQEHLQNIQGFTWASAIDLRHSYHQFPIAEADRDKTTFTYEGRRWRWARWPFGLTPATTKFQKVMETVLDGLEGVFIWVDDVIIATKGGVREHTRLVSEVLRRLNAHNLRINVEKCHFGFSKVLMLGHYVSGQERAMDPLKCQQAIDWPIPQTGKDIQRFLGFVNYIRDYIPHFARMTQPLNELRQRKGKVQLTERQLASFQLLLDTINSSAVIHTPDPSLPFQIATDASQYGIGAVLYQQAVSEAGELIGSRKYIAFAATSLNGAQKNYAATKRELLGIIFALRTFHNYVYGRKFVLYTDHKALSHLFTQKNLSYVTANWLDTLLDYDFDVRHRPGINMVLPDALSRMFNERLPEGVEEPASAHAVARAFRGVVKAAAGAVDPESALDQDLATVTVTSTGAPVIVRKFTMDEITKDPDGQLAQYINERMLKQAVLDPDKQRSLLQSLHQGDHFGAEDLFKRVWRQGYYWPRLRKQCEQLVGSCHSCLQYNVGKQGFHPAVSPSAKLPFDHIAIDCAGPFPRSERGNAYVLIMVDVASRFVVTRPMPDLKKETMARTLYEVFAQFGPPKIMQSDNGPEFVNGVLAKLVHAAGVDHRLVAPYNPRANGLAERFVQTVKVGLRKKLAGSYKRWDEALPGVTLAINTKDAALTKSPPFTLFFGRVANAWADYTVQELELVHGPTDGKALQAHHESFAAAITPKLHQNALDRQLKQNERLDEARKLVEVSYPAGSLVYIKNPRDGKDEPRWVGPFVVVRRNARSKTYVLRDLDRKVLERHFPVSQLKLASVDQAASLFSATGEALDLSAERGVVHSIMDHREADDLDRQEYLVRWKGYPAVADSWEPADHFDDDSVLVAYWGRTKPATQRKLSKKQQRAAQVNSSSSSAPRGRKRARDAR